MAELLELCVFDLTRGPSCLSYVFDLTRGPSCLSCVFDLTRGPSCLSYVCLTSLGGRVA